MDIAAIAQRHIDHYDYHEAVAFIVAHGEATVAHLVSGASKSSYTEKKVLAELERIAALPSQESKVIHTLPIDKKPEELRDLIVQRNDLVRRLDHLRGMLELIPDDDTRLSVALEILDTEDALKATWSDINYYSEKGEMPVRIPEDEIARVFFGVTTHIDLLKLRNNYRTYISRAKSGKLAHLLTFYEAVLAECEHRMKLIQ